MTGKDMKQERRTARLSEEIDANLKRVYGDMLDESVPDRFMDLLAQLKDADAAAKSKSENSDDG